MPFAAKKPCRHFNCGKATDDRYCPDHRQYRNQEIDRARPNSTQRGYGSRWQKARKGYLQSHPLCVYHLAEGETVAANVVDHIVPHRGDQKLFWKNGNWQALCKTCHDRKTATEPGGPFARPTSK